MPGLMVPPLTVIEPTVPVPRRVPEALTTTALAGCDPLTIKEPLATVMVPEYVLFPERVRRVVPVLIRPPEPLRTPAKVRLFSPPTVLVPLIVTALLTVCAAPAATKVAPLLRMREPLARALSLPTAKAP